MVDNFVPTYESTVSAYLWRDGAVMVGKLNNDEFAMGSSTESSFFGPAISPWRRRAANTPLVPGGSSGGSAAAVAAQLCLGATGTDTGGGHPPPPAGSPLLGAQPPHAPPAPLGAVAACATPGTPGPLPAPVWRDP